MFQGRIVVAQGADGTDARLRHDALLLNEGAEVDAKPELEIYADDVQCAHGNTVGALDDEQLFYIRSRGIAEVEAKALLMRAFLGEVVGADRASGGARGDVRLGRDAAGGFRLVSFDVEAARAQFPILRRQVNGRPLVYLDSAASAQKPRAVIDAMTAAMEGSYANVHRGLHTLANETTEAYEAARKSVARLVNAGEGELVFTKGATEAINLVAASLGLGWREGDEVVVSELEHHANIVPWHFLRERRGIVLRFLPVRDDGALDMDALPALLNARTRMVALTHMSNVTGWGVDAPAVARLVHAAGALLLLDGCQAVVHKRVDVQALGCDFYVFSGHKLYGPTGIGALWARGELLADMPPYQGGGEMIASVAVEEVRYAEGAHKFEAGTPAILEAIGFGAASRVADGAGPGSDRRA